MFEYSNARAVELLIKYQNNALVMGLFSILILQGRLNWLMDDVYVTDYTQYTKNLKEPSCT